MSSNEMSDTSSGDTSSGHLEWTSTLGHRVAHGEGSEDALAPRPKRIAEADRKAESEDDRPNHWLSDIDLHPPDEMGDRQDSSDIGQPVQRLPSFEAQPPHRGIGAGRRQRKQQQVSQEAHDDEVPLGDVLQEDVPVELLVDGNVSREMERGIERGEESQHPPD